MLTLLILLGVLLAGAGGFAAGLYWGKYKSKCADLQDLPLDSAVRDASQIKKELDVFLQLYLHGTITEDQYLSVTDKLIDELAALWAADSMSLREESTEAAG